MAQKKPGFFHRLFSTKAKTKPRDDEDECDDEEMRLRFKQHVARRHTVSATIRLQHNQKSDQQLMADAIKCDQSVHCDDNNQPETDPGRKCFSASTSRSNSSDILAVEALQNAVSEASKSEAPQVVLRQRKISFARTPGGTLNRRSVVQGKGQKPRIDVSRPLEFPATPEMILEYHKQRPILDENEEWLLVELNQFECLVDSLDVIRIIAKHSKFFEVGPGELWEEFFEFVDAVPSYDEVINFDVWQEFRDKRYTC